MATISAASLVDMILRLHPEHAPNLGKLADSLSSGSMGMQAFCAAVRKDLGKDVLLEALVALRSDKKRPAPQVDVRMLVQHAQNCNGACLDPGCGQINAMLQTIRTHCLGCAAPKECATCIRWGHLAAAPAPVVPARPGPLLVVSVGGAKSTSSAMSSRAHKEAMPALMMLARSALGDITDSPVGSRCNSPTASPKRLPTKRQKKDSTVPEASLLTKAVRCAPTNDRDARLVVTATTIDETGTGDAPAPLWTVHT